MSTQRFFRHKRKRYCLPKFLQNMTPNRTILLTRNDVRKLLAFKEYFDIVENAFRLHAEGKALKPSLMHVDCKKGEFHIKAGGLELDKEYFGLKVNGGFFQNMERYGMPNIQGVILLCDGETGFPLAIMESTEITVNRTAAAAAVAAKYLARPDSSSVTICGCGTQGRAQLRAMTTVLPIEKAYAFARDGANAQTFAKEMSTALGIGVVPISDLNAVRNETDVYVTCTPSRHPYLHAGSVAPGTFIAAMGADSPEKQELDVELLKGNKVVVDILEQCARVGELHHALDQGMSKEAVHGELGEIITGTKAGRTSEAEITIFDATGTALQDVAVAVTLYERAIRLSAGSAIVLFR
jgi:alanine dehydrogenase